jgi:multidrug efflux pump subunit AcrA (membrane-fusion protein)
MTIAAKAVRHAIHDKLESLMKTAEAKLDTLKARAEVAKADPEIKAIAALVIQSREIHQKLSELKRAVEYRWEHPETDLVLRIEAFEKAIKGIEAKVKAH